MSLMNRADYRAFRGAERQLSGYPPAVREIVNAAAGTAATAHVTAHPGTITTTGGAVPTIVPNVPDRPT